MKFLWKGENGLYLNAAMISGNASVMEWSNKYRVMIHQDNRFQPLAEFDNIEDAAKLQQKLVS